VRLYFKDFPLEQLHPWAKPAAIAGRCIFQQNPAAFWQYHDWVFNQQAQITPETLRSRIMGFAKGKEIDTMQLGRCMDTKATEADVDKSIGEGKALQVNGTPTLFVNGRRLPSVVSWEQLRGLIDGEIAYQKTAKNAGDTSCCEVTLASPLSK
jgi:protein-disulfide isomerase